MTDNLCVLSIFTVSSNGFSTAYGIKPCLCLFWVHMRLGQSSGKFQIGLEINTLDET